MVKPAIDNSGLDARDSRSRPEGVREFKSHPLHHILKMAVKRVNYIGLETLTNMDVIRLGSHDG